ncbi:MAG: tRNA lysidine(34) synthetase TilS [Nitrospirae bacterium]|nr:tRNA lysidine(34) synthetase TilS [Nitrospirota bacterium]
MVRDINKDESKRVNKDASQNLSKDVSQNVSKDVSQNVSKDVSQNVSKDVSQNVSRKVLEKVTSTIRDYAMLSGGETVLVGFSGGPDSTALLHLLTLVAKRLSIPLFLYAIYVDHLLRPGETPGEISFCEDLCRRLDVNFITKPLKEHLKGHPNLQARLRELRYETFEETAVGVGASKVALAHNKDDQAESVIINFLRGSSLAGLAGIPPVRGKFIRPIIDVTRSEIEDYLAFNSLGSMLDSSNLKTDYLRNRIRHTLLPVLRQYNPGIVDTLARNAAVIRDDNEFLELETVKKTMTLISRRTQSKVELFHMPMKTMKTCLVRRVIKLALKGDSKHSGALWEIGFAHVEEIVKLIKHGAHGDRVYLPNGIRAILGYSTLSITTEPPVVITDRVLDVPGEVVVGEAGVIIKAGIKAGIKDAVLNDATGDTITDLSNDFSTMAADKRDRDACFDTDRLAVCFDLDTLSLPLYVRGRRPGDYFYPLGFGRRKKLQDFFVDEKVPRDERGAIPLVVSGGEIVWVCGMRGDDRFKVTNNTRKLVQLRMLHTKMISPKTG